MFVLLIWLLFSSSAKICLLISSLIISVTIFVSVNILITGVSRCLMTLNLKVKDGSITKISDLKKSYIYGCSMDICRSFSINNENLVSQLKI